MSISLQSSRGSLTTHTHLEFTLCTSLAQDTRNVLSPSLGFFFLACPYEFCGRQLGIPPSEWTRRQIRQTMMQQGYEASLMDGVEGILEAAERARYARLDMSASAAEVYKSAVELMERMAAHR